MLTTRTPLPPVRHLVALPAAPSDEGVKILPFMAPRLEAARYSPADEEFAWVGWIGAVVDLVAAAEVARQQTAEAST